MHHGPTAATSTLAPAILILFALSLLTAGPTFAQSTTAATPREPRWLVLSQYLFRRKEITRRNPVAVFCGDAGATLLASLRQDAPKALKIDADSLLFRSTCPGYYDIRDEARKRANNAEWLYLNSLRFTPDSSIIEAVATPLWDGRLPLAFPRLERFVWDHARDVGGISLIFTNFGGPHY